jgi:hypothetical protein
MIVREGIMNKVNRLQGRGTLNDEKEKGDKRVSKATRSRCNSGQEKRHVIVGKGSDELGREMGRVNCSL